MIKLETEREEEAQRLLLEEERKNNEAACENLKQAYEEALTQVEDELHAEKVMREALAAIKAKEEAKIKAEEEKRKQE